MSDPHNVAHAKKVSQEKKHQGADDKPENPAPTQPGKKPAKKKGGAAGSVTAPSDSAAGQTAVPSEPPAATPSAALESSLAVLAKLKDLEFHSRANLERLAELALTVEDELKQKDIVAPLADAYSAQSAFQTKLTALLDTYKAECDRLQGSGS